MCLKHRLQSSIRTSWQSWELNHSQKISPEQQLERSEAMVKTRIEEWKRHVGYEDPGALNAAYENSILNTTRRLAERARKNVIELEDSDTPSSARTRTPKPVIPTTPSDESGEEPEVKREPTEHEGALHGLPSDERPSQVNIEQPSI